MNKTIGILAHVDAGKTIFSEQLLYHTNSIKKRGRVDHKDAFLDSHDIEKTRGITVFADQGIFEYKNSVYYLIDTPGHVDFSPEMERAIQVMDFAIIVISGVKGIEGHVDINQMGRVLADIQTAHGQFDSQVTEADKAIITGKVPVANFMNYGSVLASFTQGKGRITLQFVGYDRCHNEQDVIESKKYDKNADSEYTSSSIFCAKGQVFTVNWEEAEGMMHCL